MLSGDTVSVAACPPFHDSASIVDTRSVSTRTVHRSLETLARGSAPRDCGRYAATSKRAPGELKDQRPGRGDDAAARGDIRTLAGFALGAPAIRGSADFGVSLEPRDRLGGTE